MQNIHSGGVGEAYPGSTGGEIFNCYEGAEKNVASGNYSTAHGKKNSCTSTLAFAAGYNNRVSNTINYTAVALGSDNNVSGGIALGTNNTIKGNGAFGAYLNNTYGNSANGNRVRFVIGYKNKTTLLFPEKSKNIPATLVVGSGEDQQQENAIECYSNFGVANDSLVAFPSSVCLSNKVIVNAIDTPVNTPPSTNDKTLVTLGSFQKRYKSWYSSIVFTPDTPKTAADLPSGFQTAIYQATESEFTGTYWGVQVRAKFRLSPNSDETILANPVVCYNTDNGTYSHSRGFILKLEKTSSTVTITMQQGTSIDFGNNDNTFNSYVDSTTTFDVSYIQLKMTNF